MIQKNKKSLYIYLSSLMGVLLFLTLHRVVFFFLSILGAYGIEPLQSDVSSLLFMGIEYFTLILAMMLGAWYGIWVGLYWFEKVYVEGNHPGVVGHLADCCWPAPKNRYRLEAKLESAEKKLEADMWELESLAKAIPVTIASPEPIKRRVVRKKAPKIPAAK